MSSGFVLLQAEPVALVRRLLATALCMYIEGMAIACLRLDRVTLHPRKTAWLILASRVSICTRTFPPERFQQ